MRRFQWWQQCATIAKTLMRHRDSAPFHKPVDPVALKCPDYLTIIKTPMDLGTALARLGGFPPHEARFRRHGFDLDRLLGDRWCEAGRP